MRDNKVLVKVICHKTSFLSQFGGVITSPVPIHEIYELKQEIKTPRVIVGEKVIACLGEVVIKAYCVKKDTLDMFLVEHCFHYRNYLAGHYPFHHLKPHISVQSDLQGLITESIECNEITLTGIISTQLIFSLEKECHLSAIQDRGCQCDGTVDCKTEEYDPGYSAQEPPVDVNEERLIQSKEIYTKVVEGVNEDLMIILD